MDATTDPCPLCNGSGLEVASRLDLRPCEICRPRDEDTWVDAWIDLGGEG